MNESQKALDRIETNFCACCFDQYISPCDCPAKEDFEIIKKDLERLEKLEKVIKILKKKLTFSYDNTIFVIHKDIFNKKHPQIRIVTNYEEDELLKEVLEYEKEVEVDE